MDYQVFLVRPPGQSASNRASRGGGLRLFRILDHGISVLPLGTPNAAPTEYRFEHVSKVSAADDDPTELRIEILDTSKSGFGCETVRFCCEARTSLLTALMNRLDDMNGIGIDYSATKHSYQRGGLVETIYRVRSASIVKMVNLGHRSDHKITASKKVNFQDIVKLEILSDDEQIVLVSLRSRTMRLAVKDSVAFVCAIQRNMKAYLKWDVEIEKIETSVMVDYFAKQYKKVREYPVLFEFQALKQSKLHNYDGPRTLSITKNLLIESSFNEIINVHSLEDLRGLVVNEKNDQEVVIEFASWRDSHFLLRDRDDFLASVADVMGMEKGSTFSIRLEHFHSHMFPEQQNALFQSECETFYLNRFMAAYNSSREAWALHMPLKEYAANILVGESQCTDLKVLQAVADTLKQCIGKPKPDTVRATTCCIVLVRILGSKPCFDAVRNLPEFATVMFQCVRSLNSIISYHATLVIRSAIKLVVQRGSADGGVASKQEFANRLLVLSAENLQQLVTLLHTHALAKHNSLQVTSILNILTYALSSPPADNEAGRLWLRAYEASIMATADLLCAFFRLTSDVVFTRLSILLQALLTTMSPVVCENIQNVCVRRCVLLLHLSTAVFSKKPHLRLLSCSQIFLVMEGNHEAKKLLTSVLPMGVMNLYANKVSELDGQMKSTGNFTAWMDTLELLYNGTVETPLLVWNSVKRSELRKFLRDEMEGYYAALETNKDVWYNSADVQLVYSIASEGGGTVVRGVHLELLVDHHPPTHGLLNSFWKLGDPLPLFQSVYQAMLLGFTPLFGSNNLPEIDLRLAVHVLTWIYERHSDEVAFCMETLKVIETVVGMLREVIDSEHEVFVFKLVIFLLATLEKGKRENVIRFTHAGGAAVLASLMVISADKGCKNKMEFECNGSTNKDALAQGAFEMVDHVGSDGVSRLVRIPSGRAREVMGKSVQDGSLEAKDGIRWQDKQVPPKIQLALVLDQLETLLRISGDSSSKQHYPPSSAVLSLSKEETIYHLVQVLLRLKSPEFGRVLEILLIVVKANKSAMRRLYSLGAFEILLWKVLAGDLVDWEKDMICKFLLECHLKQDQGTLPMKDKDDTQDGQSLCKGSVLRLYLPDGLILRLMSEDIESYRLLASVLNTEHNTPDIIWNKDMRQRLLDHLTNELEPYVKARASDPLAPYVHILRPRIEHPELDDIVFSAPFYLQNLLDKDRFPDYPIRNPDGFLSSLMLNLWSLVKGGNSNWCKELQRIQLLIQALAHVVDRHSLRLPSDTEHLLVTAASPSLQTCQVEKERFAQVSIDILHYTVKVLRKFVAGKTTKSEELPMAALNFSLDVLSLGTQESANINILDSAIAGALSVLEIISSNRDGRKYLWDDLRWQNGMQWALSAAVNDTPAGDSSLVSYSALSSLKHFAGDTDYSRRIIDEGLYLLLLLLVIPSPNVDPKSQAAKSTLPISAADVLGSFVRAEGTKVSSLSNVLPRPLLSCLQNDEDLGKFMSMARSDIRTPTTIWNAEVRSELRDRALAKSSSHDEEESVIQDELQWLQSFKYACLQREFVIGGVFVNHLAAGKWEGDDELPENTVFLDLMMEYLEKERNVVNAGEEVEDETEGYEDKHVIIFEGVPEQRDQAAELDKFVLVLVAFRECLKYAVSHAKNDLIRGLRVETFFEIASMEQCAPKAWAQVMYIFKVLAQDEVSQNAILQSNLLGIAGIYLWDAVTEDKGAETEAVVLATLDMLHFLSESVPATVEVTNCFSNSGVLFPLLCLFCDVDLPSLRTGIMETEKITTHQRLLASCILGQLLLCSSGVANRVKFLGENSLVQKGHPARVTTEIDDLMNFLEPGYKGVKPLVFQTIMLLMPLELLSTLARNPARACEMYKETVYLPRLVWDDDTRRCVKQLLTEEAIKLQGFVKNQVVAGLSAWALELEQPVFTRWVLAVVSDTDSKPVYKNSREEGYVPEIYLGGFFVDQFLRVPEFFFGNGLEQRFFREVKKAIVLGIYADELDSLRRLVLSLLLLFKGRPYLLAGRSYIDIFLAVSRYICSTGAEARMLSQPVIILTHSIANHKDIVDIIVSEDLIHSLVDFLDLEVPEPDAGFAGTDPRLCSLMLLLRLIRLSPPTTEITSTDGVVQKLAETVLDMEANNEVSKTALECLALMCHDKRKGKEVIRLLESLVPADVKGFWDIPVENIWDEAADFEVLQHFLQNRYPCAWWTTDKSCELLENGVGSAAAPSASGIASLNVKVDTNGGEKDGEINFKGNVSEIWDAHFSQDHSS